MADLLGGGGGHVPVLNGDSRANRSRGPSVPDSRAAGAGRGQQSSSVYRAELEGDRKMKAPGMNIERQYDAYLDASEEYTFGKLHATLAKHERRAAREHAMYNGAAGWTTEHRNELADARAEPGQRRCRSPARFGQHEQNRMGAADGVAGLMQQGEYINGLPQERMPSYRERAPSPRGRAPSPRGRAPSPMRQHPAVPPLGSARSDGPPTDRGYNGPARATSPFAHRAASPRPQRAASPRRERPGAA